MDDTARRASGLPLLSLLCVGLLAGGLALGVGMGGVMPLPYGPVAAVAAYVRAQPDAVRVIAVATFASSVPLALYAATAAARLRRLGAGPTTAAITLTGGTLAAGLLALAGLLGWTLSRPAVTADTAVVAALYLLVFLTGGPGHIVALGVLVAAMAVPGLTRGGAAPARRAGRSGHGRTRRVGDRGADLARAGRDLAGRAGGGAGLAAGRGNCFAGQGLW
ncbi:hypothetical protein LIX17_08310 [Mycobacterium avium subsp. hominissuis]|uniref:hypothetical protein n=1 Tax=Mycobacterium avium complex (MAC) TaxID=120793 RepID=UPI0004469E3C|nr:MULTISPECIES: hypothetical protein [Mycobacterium avium complex (MAC)]ETZ41675.1 hypothetical protein L838_4577 [Mycobacterium avium MAV_120709_2344]ETZ59999.1 hypothetical protein L841_4379 [Mycobacterium sp. MAC_080597_8934]ETZ67052.1 hypothetical protein L840_1704 [Mycobacterium sp. MAC_011194_8550]